MMTASHLGLRATLVVLLAALPLVVAAAPGAADWVERMARSMTRQDYVGTFIYHHDGRIEAMRIVHRRTDEGVRERLISLNGAAREVLRDDEKVTCFFPDSESVMVDRRAGRNPLTEVVPREAERLEPYYDLALGSEGRVAGRDAQRVVLSPRDGFRYGYEFWIDRERGVLLRSDLIGTDGAAVEQIMFTEIDFPRRIPDDWLKPRVSGEGYTWMEFGTAGGEPEAAALSEWQVTDLPPGFALRSSEYRAIPGSDGPVAHYLFSDGLASVSVYVDRQESAVKPLIGGARMGAMSAYGRVIADHQVVVVGETPMRTVKAVAESVARSGEREP